MENGSIYAVIGLPAGIFFNTGIPTCVVILKKNNTDRSILFIDASKEFRKEKARNCMDAEHIDKIVNTYMERKDVDKFAHLASFEEIKKNDFNLNIPRYVDTSEPEEVDLSAVSAQIAELDMEIKKGMDELLPLAQDMGVTVDEEASRKMLADVVKMLQGV